MRLRTKIRNKWTKIRLQPIRVYCLHHVCKQFGAEWMREGDWMPIDEFKCKVLALRQSGLEFISLTEAHRRLALSSAFRQKRYAVLTFDDGYASLKEILPWLEDQNIPVTLFINGKYLDGQSYRESPAERYLTQADINAITSPLVEIGSHGWEHTSAIEMSVDEFESSLVKNVTLLSQHPNWIPFHAYTWGKHIGDTDTILKKQNIIPILIDGMKNYNDPTCIQRELLK